MRWADVLFSQGFGTRAACRAIVGSGLVQHEGALVVDPDAEIAATPGLEFVVEGRVWPYRERALVLLHKPVGYECSRRPGGHPGVMALLPAPLVTRGVQPVGRLDADTTGALLLTDDGALLHRLTHPRHHVAKVYVATTKHAVDAGVAARLVQGVVLRDDPAPVRAVACEASGERTLRLTLTDGRYHQVKRMIAAVGNRCEALHRESFGDWRLPADLAPGQWRWVEP